MARKNPCRNQEFPSGIISDDGKIWLLENNTEWLVAEELVRRGVPSHDIVIGFHPPQYRKYTDFAVA